MQEEKLITVHEFKIMRMDMRFKSDFIRTFNELVKKALIGQQDFFVIQVCMSTDEPNTSKISRRTFCTDLITTAGYKINLDETDPSFINDDLDILVFLPKN